MSKDVRQFPRERFKQMDVESIVAHKSQGRSWHECVDEGIIPSDYSQIEMMVMAHYLSKESEEFRRFHGTICTSEVEGYNQKGS